VGISDVGRQSYFLARLKQKLLRSSSVTAQVVVIILLRLIDFLPSLLDELLCSSHVPVSLANIYRRLLRKHHCTKDKSCADRDAHHQDSLSHGLFLQYEQLFDSGLARQILPNFGSCF
jgi:hypothetical protein